MTEWSVSKDKFNFHLHNIIWHAAESNACRAGASWCSRPPAEAATC